MRQKRSHCHSEREQNILSAFLNGYDSVRPFTNLQKDIYPYLCAVISAYWLGDMSFDEGNLKSLIEKKQADAICRFMNNMRNRLIDLQEFPLLGWILIYLSDIFPFIEHLNTTKEQQRLLLSVCRKSMFLKQTSNSLPLSPCPLSPGKGDFTGATAPSPCRGLRPCDPIFKKI